VSAHVPVRGMFLLAPAFFMRGYEQYTPVPAECPIAIVHGWNDDIVPVENAIRFAREYKCELHVLDSDHRLTADIEQICELFDHFLGRLTVAPGQWTAGREPVTRLRPRPDRRAAIRYHSPPRGRFRGS